MRGSKIGSGEVHICHLNDYWRCEKIKVRVEGRPRGTGGLLAKRILN